MNSIDSVRSMIKQAVKKEPFLSYSKAGETPVQWLRSLHALDQQDLPSWPLLSPLEVQMQKCDKCSREFCSPINHRRHVCVDHRRKNLDSSADRNTLRTFWDQLSLDKAKETVSLENATLKLKTLFSNDHLADVAGSTIIASLASLVRKHDLSSQPQALKVASSLLDIIQGKFGKRISSEKLFSILNDASEKTFLSGKAESVQKYVFNGEAGKIDLETNITACASFLVEQKLVKAWYDHRELEALKAQEKLLMEEVPAKRKARKAR